MLDRLLALALFVGYSLESILSDRIAGPAWAHLLLGAVMAGSFLWRRDRPLVTLVVTLAGAIVGESFMTGPPNVVTAILMLVSAIYAVGAHSERREALVGLGLGVISVFVLAAMHDTGDIFWPVTFFCIVPWLAGRTLQNQTRLARELAEKADRAEHAREEEERRSIAEERSRIARELHDVLAHNLSVMVVQAGAARRIAERDADGAAQAAELIRGTGRDALAELRHLFGPVRRGEGESLAGPPSLKRVDRLVARARDAGLEVEARLEGREVDLPAGVDLTAYRVVQEALTNVIKHAGAGRVRVLVSYEPWEVVVEVEDDGVGARANGALEDAGGGHGLVGMRERVTLYGGSFQAGPRRGGGFAVRARLPTIERTARTGVPA
ncbi:MAG TPA: histidine kinase [Thermoleophilaceae bacterium]|nr:histidine kinase [Thermoleophilaceae bacterium]